ncbi:uncharacterized protein YjbJ (UPF0337 family) [Rhodococcus sp. PvR044]|jgi:uncharacterized protein YjbJ (UPF0337 family)|nr:uncharacterized protein YjbJ (UPF0337 family) [Rhodococcus sp. PvR099]PTR40486.1 uncharacterized protein YjbJ (UPF0337 family) [Rhodococcus sp. OK611]SNX92177.1 Uncharacterized conserved protein YjbJ, UPF0337 family [Rhodococcus sp. OK270]
MEAIDLRPLGMNHPMGAATTSHTVAAQMRTTLGPARGPITQQRRSTAMSIGKKLRHKAETAEGAAKKTVGKALGNERMEAEGRADQAKGNAKQTGDKLKQAGQKIKHAFKH